MRRDEKSRFHFIETGEAGRRKPLMVKPAPETLAPEQPERLLAEAAGPPGALDPIPQFPPFGGITEFWYLYTQLQNLDTALAAQGPASTDLNDLADVVITNPQNGETLLYSNGNWVNGVGGGGGASLSVANTWTALQTFCVDDTNNDVRRPVSLCHTHSGDLAAAPIGVGMAFEVELSLGGARQTIAQIDADTTALGSSAGSETGRLLLNVTSAGTENNELALYPQQLTIPRAPLSSSTRSRVQIGSSNWHFGGGAPAGNLTHGNAAGNVLGINEPTGYTGLLAALAVNGQVRFEVGSTTEHKATIWDTATTGPTTAFRLQHRLTSGNGAVGHGVGLEFWQANASGTLHHGAKIHSEYSDATAGAENVGLVFTTRVGGTDTDVGRFSGSTGNLNSNRAVQAIDGFLAGTLTGKAALVDIQGTAEAGPLPADYTALKVTSGALTGIPVGGVPNDVTFSFGSTHELATGNRLAANNIGIVAPIWTAVGATQIDVAAALQVGIPLAGANVTIPERYSIRCSGPIFIEAAVNGFVFRLPEDTTTTVGAAGGRIPINVNNVIKYLQYYNVP